MAGIPRRGYPSRMKKGNLAESKITVSGDRGIKVEKSCFIRETPHVLYEFWRDLANLSRIIKHPVAISTPSATESHWEVSAPGKHPVSWDAVIINDEPDQLIAWQSKDGAQVPNAGSVRFTPTAGDGGTEVTVKLDYDPPGGKLGELVARFTRDAAGQQVSDALARLKYLFEGSRQSPRSRDSASCCRLALDSDQSRRTAFSGTASWT
jgi:uncharacterized membrane protein